MPAAATAGTRAARRHPNLSVTFSTHRRDGAFDPDTGQPRTFNDLARRRADLKLQVCPSDPIPPGPGMGGVGGGRGGTGVARLMPRLQRGRRCGWGRSRTA